MADHVIPYAGRNDSGPVVQNLLWRAGNVFLMDNHRAALWCWQQMIDLYKDDHSILHIDRHTDALSANIECHLAQMPDLRGLSITDYLAADVEWPGCHTKLFRWDNYLSIHIGRFASTLKWIVSADHGDGDDPNWPCTQRPIASELAENIGYWLLNANVPTIVNVDLDYLFYRHLERDEEGGEEWRPLFHEGYIENIFENVKLGLDSKNVAGVTVCFTPSGFTPGWETCIDLGRTIFDILGAPYPDDL